MSENLFWIGGKQIRNACALKTISDGRFISDYKLNKINSGGKLIKLCKKKVRLPLECVPIPFWNKMDEKLANSDTFSIVRDSLTNCM